MGDIKWKSDIFSVYVTLRNTLGSFHYLLICHWWFLCMFAVLVWDLPFRCQLCGQFTKNRHFAHSASVFMCTNWLVEW